MVVYPTEGGSVGLELGRGTDLSISSSQMETSASGVNETLKPQSKYRRELGRNPDDPPFIRDAEKEDPGQRGRRRTRHEWCVTKTKGQGV